MAVSWMRSVPIRQCTASKKTKHLLLPLAVSRKAVDLMLLHYAIDLLLTFTHLLLGQPYFIYFFFVTI